MVYTPFLQFAGRAAISAGAVLGCTLTAIFISSPAVGQEPTVSPQQEQPTPNANSDDLKTRPAQASASELINPETEAIRVEDEPLLIFTFDDRTLSPREQIELNRPENSNAIHFPLAD